LVEDIIDIIGHPVAFPADERAVDNGLPASANRGPMDEGEVDDIQLVFNRSGIMKSPDFAALGISPACEKFFEIGDFCWSFFFLAIPSEDKTAFFLADIGIHFEVGRDRCAFSIGWNEGNLAIGVIFKTMEGALRMAVEKVALAQRSPAVASRIG